MLHIYNLTFRQVPEEYQDELFILEDELNPSSQYWEEEEEEGIVEIPVEAPLPNSFRLSGGAAKIIQAALAEEENLKAQAKAQAKKDADFLRWQKRQFGWQEMLLVVKAKWGVDLLDLSLEEWDTKQITKERAKALGVKSPKLSKVLTALGVPIKETSIFLGASYSLEDKNGEPKGITRVEGNAIVCKEQGNSKHYSSCQATSPLASWQGGLSYNRIAEDLQVVGKSLFFWVVGEPISANGEGYKARAKVRIMYKDSAGTIPAGLYLDRPYGKYNILLDNLSELEAWWGDFCVQEGWEPNLPILMPPLWNRDNGGGNDFQSMYSGRYPVKLFCPSAEKGYQDTLTHGRGGYDCFSQVGEAKANLLVRIYSSRSKIGRVHHVTLKKVTYNPQNGSIKAPEVTLPTWRGIISEEHRMVSRFLWKVLGVRGTRYISGCTYELYIGETRLHIYYAHYNGYIKYELEAVDLHKRFVTIKEWKPEEGGHLEWEVKEDLPELGFIAPQLIPFEWKQIKTSTGEVFDQYLVRWDREEDGFLVGEDWKHYFGYQIAYNGDNSPYGYLYVNNESPEEGFISPVGIAYGEVYQNEKIWKRNSFDKKISVGIAVRKDLPEFGFAIPCELPYTWSSSTRALVVTNRSQERLGFYKAVPLR